jgi:hypothetical protein
MGNEDQLPQIHKDKLIAKREGLILGDDFPGNGMSWTYQFCSQFGWYQVQDPEHPMRSKLLD